MKKILIISLSILFSVYTYGQKIEAEDYTSMSGIQTENTSDAGGGKNVGWIDNKDWMEYAVPITSTGTFTINLRIAAIVATAKVEIKVGGTVQQTISIPNTGAWQSWQTITTSLNLTKGNNIIRLTSIGGQWNINWLEFIPPAIPTPPTTNLYYTAKQVDSLLTPYQEMIFSLGVRDTLFFNINNKKYYILLNKQ